jgi:glutamyl-Q tRNA(Asp) synthetase
MNAQYVGRFAPSPTGFLHAGSLVAALASFIDAKAHNGRWLIRIEDVDQTRCKTQWADSILNVLDRLEMKSDGPIIWQSQRTERYSEVLQRLIDEQKVYGCSCSRQTIEEFNRKLSTPPHRYPGLCRNGAEGPIRAWRFLTNQTPVSFTDRWMGSYTQNVEEKVGDFVVKRADGLFAYQLAVIVDDHDSGVTDIVRGADLIDNTPRQLVIYRALGWQEPRYMHIPLVLNDRQEKLSKQGGAKPLSEDLMAELQQAWRHLGFDPILTASFQDFYEKATQQWQKRFKIRIQK